MNRVLEEVAWITATHGMKTVQDVLSMEWDPPPRVVIFARRGGQLLRTESVLSLDVQWHRLDPADFVVPD